MSMEFTIDPEHRAIVCYAQDVVSLDDVLEYHRALVRQDIDITGMIEYVDMSGLEEMNVKYSTGQEILSNYLRTLHDRLRGTVFYAPTELGFGMANMMHSTGQSMAGAEKLKVMIVREPIALEDLHAEMDALLTGSR